MLGPEEATYRNISSIQKTFLENRVGRGGETLWDINSIRFIANQLPEEVDEIREAITQASSERVLLELADIIIFCSGFSSRLNIDRQTPWLTYIGQNDELGLSSTQGEIDNLKPSEYARALKASASSTDSIEQVSLLQSQDEGAILTTLDIFIGELCQEVWYTTNTAKLLHDISYIYASAILFGSLYCEHHDLSVEVLDEAVTVKLNRNNAKYDPAIFVERSIEEAWKLAFEQWTMEQEQQFPLHVEQFYLSDL